MAQAFRVVLFNADREKNDVSNAGMLRVQHAAAALAAGDHATHQALVWEVVVLSGLLDAMKSATTNCIIAMMLPVGEHSIH